MRVRVLQPVNGRGSLRERVVVLLKLCRAHSVHSFVLDPDAAFSRGALPMFSCLTDLCGGEKVRRIELAHDEAS